MAYLQWIPRGQSFALAVEVESRDDLPAATAATQPESGNVGGEAAPFGGGLVELDGKQGGPVGEAPGPSRR